MNTSKHDLVEFFLSESNTITEDLFHGKDNVLLCMAEHVLDSHIGFSLSEADKDSSYMENKIEESVEKIKQLEKRFHEAKKSNEDVKSEAIRRAIVALIFSVLGILAMTLNLIPVSLILTVIGLVLSIINVIKEGEAFKKNMSDLQTIREKIRKIHDEAQSNNISGVVIQRCRDLEDRIEKERNNMLRSA